MPSVKCATSEYSGFMLTTIVPGLLVCVLLAKTCACVDKARTRMLAIMPVVIKRFIIKSG